MAYFSDHSPSFDLLFLYTFKKKSIASNGERNMDEGSFKGAILPRPFRCFVRCAHQSSSGADAVPPGYTTPIPSELLTPDKVRTSVGTFNFFDGMPDAATVDTSFDNLKFIRAYETFSR